MKYAEGSAIVGIPIWYDSTIEDSNIGKLTIRTDENKPHVLGHNTFTVFRPEYSEELCDIIAVYEFYDMCRILAREQAYSNVGIDEIYIIDFDIPVSAVNTEVLKYFGTDRVRRVLSDYDGKLPRGINSLYRYSKIWEVPQNRTNMIEVLHTKQTGENGYSTISAESIT